MWCVWAFKPICCQKHLIFFWRVKFRYTRCNLQHFAFHLRAKFKELVFKLAAHSGTQSMGTVFLELSELSPWLSAMCWLLVKGDGPCWCLQGRWTVGMEELDIGGSSTINNHICVFLWSYNLSMGQTKCSLKLGRNHKWQFQANFCWCVRQVF